MSENFKPVTPMDVLADGVDTGEFRGTEVRKGTVKAAIENAKALRGMTPGSAEYEATVGQLRELKPALIALGVFDVFEVKDPAVAAIFGD
jgi:hypothetical protein